MSDQPLTLIALAQFHRQVILPDIERIVGNTVQGAETRLRDEMQTLHDVVLKRLDRLEIEYEMIKVGLQRVEERVEGLEGRLDHLEAMVVELRTRLGRVEERLEEMIAVEEKYPLRVEVQDLKARVERLHEDVRRLEHRIKPSVKR